MSRPAFTYEQSVEAFWAKVDKTGPLSAHSPDGLPCWVWTGAKQSSRKGHYGHLYVLRVHKLAHRFAWELEYGRLPGAGLDIDHICRVKLCVRPSHLRESTRTDNNLNRSGPDVNNRSTGVRCVYPNATGKPYVGVATYAGRGIRKTFDTVEAASAWVAEAREKMKRGEM